MTIKFKKNVLSLAKILIEDDYYNDCRLYEIRRQQHELDETEYKQVSLLLLRHLNDTKKPLNRSAGICNQFHAFHIELTSLINLTDWPHYSGISFYPIKPTRSFKSPEVQYHETGDKWCCGEYSVLRWELIQYTINKLEEELSE